MKKNFIKYFFALFISLNCFAQNPTEQKIINEAQKRQIKSIEDAVEELNKYNISIDQATKMAQMQGVDLNTFLSKNFNISPDLQNKNKVTDDVVSSVDIVVEPESPKLNSNPEIQINIDSNIYFGYDIFKNNPFATKDYLVGNIDEGYLLSPGDELRITVFGNNALSTQSKIDLNGNIVFPDLGVFQAAGNSLKSLKSRLKIFLGKFYNGLVSNPQNAFLDISLTQIRPVTVNVLGEALTPGPHLVNGLATVLNAIYAAGGIKTSGSLRKIILYRNNKAVKEFDLYDYITAGNIDSDVRLMSGDIIFIPPRLNNITLKGNVKNSAIYELKNDETISDLVGYSGGLMPDSSTDNVNISRIKSFESRLDDDIYDRSILTLDFFENPKFNLIDGDIVSFNSILLKRLNEVTLSGNVNNPGIYSLTKYSNLKSLIENAGKGLAPNTFLEKVDIYKQDLSGNKSFVTYNLDSVLNGDIEIELEQDDEVMIYSLDKVEGNRLIKISGFGTNEKTLFWRDNLSIFDLVFESTSFNDPFYRTNVLASRIDVDSFNQNTGKFFTTIYSFNDLIKLKNTYLKPDDRVRLYSRAVTQNLFPTISVIGDVNSILESIPLRENMHVEDAIAVAGGFKEFANQKTVQIIRRNKYSETDNFSETINYNIDSEYLLGNKSFPDNPQYLQDYDIVVVNTLKRDNFLPTLSLFGEVNINGVKSISDYDQTLDELISNSNGLTDYAFLMSSEFVRDGKLLAFNSEKDLLSQRLISDDNIKIGSILYDVEVSGDGITNSTYFTWIKGRKARKYIRLAGGKKDRIERSYIIRKNGVTAEIKKIFSNPIIYPGDKIIVQRKPDKVNNNSFVNDFTNIFGTISGILTTILLVTKL